MKAQRPYKSIDDRKVWGAGVRHLKKSDLHLAGIINSVGAYDVGELRKDYYATLVRSIIFQQLAGGAAKSIMRKFQSLYGGRTPSPRQFLKTPENVVRSAGVSPQKYSYIKDLCERIENGSLELRKFDNMHNEDIINELDQVRGIGRWTAEMFLIFSLGRTDVVPFDDLGFRKAAQKAYKLRKLPERDRLRRISKRWQPYGTIATIYMWRSLDSQ